MDDAADAQRRSASPATHGSRLSPGGRPGAQGSGSRRRKIALPKRTKLSDWNRLVSRLNDDVGQGRDKAPPEQYRRAIEQYFRPDQSRGCGRREIAIGRSHAHEWSSSPSGKQFRPSSWSSPHGWRSGHARAPPTVSRDDAAAEGALRGRLATRRRCGQAGARLVGEPARIQRLVSFARHRPAGRHESVRPGLHVARKHAEAGRVWRATGSCCRLHFELSERKRAGRPGGARRSRDFPLR